MTSCARFTDSNRSSPKIAIFTPDSGLSMDDYVCGISLLALMGSAGWLLNRLHALGECCVGHGCQPWS